jgi:hypothetical protein
MIIGQDPNGISGRLVGLRAMLEAIRVALFGLRGDPRPRFAGRIPEQSDASRPMASARTVAPPPPPARFASLFISQFVLRFTEFRGKRFTLLWRAVATLSAGTTFTRPATATRTL